MCVRVYLCIHESESVSCSVVSNSVIPWTLAIACQASLSMGFSRQEYWSGLPFPSLGDLPDPGIEPESPALQADSLLSEQPVYYFACFQTWCNWYYPIRILLNYSLVSIIIVRCIHVDKCGPRSFLTAI